MPRLKKGEDLYRGLMGISFSAALYTADPVIEAVRQGSPAEAAGLKAGDRIAQLDGRPMRTARRTFARNSVAATRERKCGWQWSAASSD